MSSYFEITFIEGGVDTHHRAPWGGDLFDRVAFWGPEAVRAFARSCPSSEGRRHWAEGGGVVDFDRRVFLWYGGADVAFDPELRRAFRTLLRRQWPGWDERWAEADAETVHDYLGHDGYFTPAIPPDHDVGLRLDPAPDALLREHLGVILTILRRGLDSPESDADARELARRNAVIDALEVELGQSGDTPRAST